MKRIAVFAGSFDPITLGHESVVKRALALFDEVIIAVGINTSKNYMFGMEQRIRWIKAVFAGEHSVKVETFEGLTVDFCRKKGAYIMLRGIRNSIDFEYEMSIAAMNRDLNPGIETIFLPTLPEHSHINATIVREIIKSGGDASRFVPAQIVLK